MTSTEPLIRLESVSKEYRLGFWLHRRVHALRDLTMDVRRGEVFGLLGPNGAGKSTTIKILMNLVRATRGTATLFGQAPSNREMRRRLGFVPENPAPYEYLTGREFLSLAASLAEVPRREIRSRVDEVLAAVNMERAGNLRIRRYSKGMIQRIAIGQALVHRPELLVLDEPTSGLDPLGRKLVRDLILSERRRGTTILFSSHIISDVEAVCERVAVLVGGKLVRSGGVAELLTNQVPVAEVVVEGLTAEVVRSLGTAVQQVEALDGRLRVRVADDQVDQFIGAVMARGGRIRQLQPERFSLEDMFLSALQEAGPRGTVGGEISE
ncbi:MAG TPA: ABC transporter ATP-binding protein [Myxococcaceae bacterium]|nr:ABC transporter ATP-binding protein [Myxococcaceae bacterium]